MCQLAESELEPGYVTQRNDLRQVSTLFTQMGLSPNYIVSRMSMTTVKADQSSPNAFKTSKSPYLVLTESQACHRKKGASLSA